MKKKTDEQSEVLEKQIEEWKGKYLRALADYQNLEKRTQEEASNVRRFAAEMVLTKLLAVADTLEKAQEHLNDTGLSLALKELAAVFSSQGVIKLEVMGKPFDPKVMECIEVGEGENNMVVEELTPGYTLYGKVMRVARVKVGRKQESTNDKSTNKQMNDTINQ